MDVDGGGVAIDDAVPPYITVLCTTYFSTRYVSRRRDIIIKKDHGIFLTRFSLHASSEILLDFRLSSEKKTFA